ncbi:hypothetical protein [Rhodococcus sp. SORGH_AS_0301]|uniref:hypothetical protein n=1 Tax=Rhodococcus sp. SORGH_AS_0301 TaxID=3041780 RepID=UPI0027D81452|nr:hypothetical protein [Rhodococcus sp. SORGH_AS_0301]
MDAPTRKAVQEKWLYPKEVQQNETKRRGHGAEAEIARVLSECGIKILPENKAINPMGGYDPNVSLDTFEIVKRDAARTVSADIVVLDKHEQPRALVFALVQSSDPGQFGVDKAKTNIAIRERLEFYKDSTQSVLEMWGIVDGIGYSENVNGTLAPMLHTFDDFFQHKSSYKSALAANRLGLCTVLGIRFDEEHYSAANALVMGKKYAPGVPVLGPTQSAPRSAREVSAGWATIWVDQ